MSTDRLSNPPLLDTDLSTSDYWITLGGKYPHKFVEGGITAVTSVPAGFSDANYRNGLIVCVTGSQAASRQRLRLAFHAPAGNVVRYGSNWDLLVSPPLDTIIGDPANVYINPPPTSIFAAQRLGSRIYALVNYFDHFVVTESDIREQYPFFNLVRIDGSGSGDISQTTYPGVASFTQAMPLYVNDLTHAFASDDEYPFVWIRENFGTDMYVTGFWDNPSQFPSDPHAFLGVRNVLAHSVQQEGQLGAYRQKINTFDAHLGSFLVHPWGAGDYGPPELWHVVTINSTTFDVYRSKWVRGAWALPPDYTFMDSQLDSGRFPTYNPHGYAFEPDWFNTSHKVARISSVPGGIDVSMDQPVFQFIRDPVHSNRLHLVINALEDGPVDGVYSVRNIWNGTSHDDGASWTNLKQMRPAYSFSGQGDGFLRTGNVTKGARQAARVMENNTLAIVEDNWDYTHNDDPGDPLRELKGKPADAGPHGAFIVLDPITQSAATPEAGNVIFKRGENRGQAAWL